MSVVSLPSTNMERRHNNLDIMRLAAAIFVIVSHAFPIVGAAEPRSWLNPTGHSWGNLGVLIFFSISGYLIAGSWVKDPAIGRYWAKRTLRLIPGLFTATALSAWALGPFFTNVTPSEYFRSAGSWLYPFQETLMFTPAWVELNGVFEKNPMRDMNASLWTLPIEVLCYFGVMMLFLLHWNRPALVFAAAVLFALLGSTELQSLLGLDMPINSQMSQAGTFISTFLCGTLLFLLKEKLPLKMAPAIMALACAILLSFTPFGTLVAPFVVAYTVLAIGLKAPVLPLGKFRGWDLSYGTYIFAFPMEQGVQALTGTANPWLVAVSSTIIVLPIAALSWRFIERPALTLAPRKKPAYNTSPTVH